MILAILFAYLGYKKAEETGRGKGLWAFLMVVIFVGVQLFAGLLVGVFIGVGITAWGWSENAFDDYYWPINLVGVAASIAICSGVLYLLGRSPKSDTSEPPPPSEFGLE
jgi:hypothetical protein